MKIKSMHIYGYGKWIDQTFTFDPHFQIISGPNEAGKSTLLSFIQSILFGFPKKSEKDLRYESKLTSAYGGYLIVETKKYGKLRLERVSERRVMGELTITNQDGEQLSEAVLDELLGQLDRASFKALYGFNLSDLEEVKTLAPEEIQTYFTSIGATGSDRFMTKIDELSQQSDELFKPRGKKPAINQLLSKMNQLKTKMNELQTHYQNYIDNEAELTKYYAELDQLNYEKDQLSSKIEQLSTYQEHVKQQEQVSELSEKIRQLPDLEIPENLLYQFDHLNEETKDLKAELEQLVQQRKQQTEQLSLTSEQKFYLAERSQFADYEENINEINQGLKEMNWIQKQMDELKSQFEKIAWESGLSPSISESNLPTKLSSEDEKQIADWIEKSEASRQSSQKIEMELDRNEQTESELLRIIEDNRAQLKHETPSQVATPSHRLWLPALFIIISFIIFSTGFFMATPTSYALWLIGLVGFGVAGYGVYRAESKKNDQQEQRELFSQLAKQTQRAENQLTHLHADSEQLTQQLEHLQREMITGQNDFNRWKIQNAWPKEVKLVEVSALDKSFKHLRQLQSSWLANQEQIINLEDQLLAVASDYPLLKDVEEKNGFHLAKLVANSYNDIVASIQPLEPILKQIKKSADKERNLESEINLNEQKMNQLLQSVEAADKAELEEIVKTQEERESLLDQRNWLLKQLGDEEIPYKDQAALDEQKERWLNEKEQLNKRTAAVDDERMHLEAQMLQMAQDGTYENDRLAFESYKTEMSQKIDEWISLKLALYLLDRLLKSDLDNRYPLVRERLNEYFVRLTEGRYEKVLLREGEWLVLDRHGQTYTLEELSRGTIELLYLSFRLSFVYSNRDILNLPLIIDDAFVNFDEQRYREVLKLLKELSEDIQIIYLTINKRLATIDEDLSIIYLKR